MNYTLVGVMPIWMAKIVEGISYKPGWTLHITAQCYDFGPRPHEPYIFSVAARCTVKDVVTGNDLLLHGPRVNIYREHMEEKHIVQMIFASIRTLEQHEMEEQFSYNGCRIYDPHREHAENEKRFELAALRPKDDPHAMVLMRGEDDPTSGLRMFGFEDRLR
jgi:hypothetical protein